ncbi:hypothetical protein [Heyndrickxia sporothermodurans]|uniref:hypothetical protein n=1 Tax=Heyndrickxia sporothermodurans TaxID=46224 RepID=UPI001472C623|nr:hypothetical protein [Heyndrickxia sporothermodurans]MED1711748.1 hypothetical protein [Bacillus thuringiensis]MBL5768006.1 hypothetical protein [Heyndrickxia sporothermodurans]MBL5771599.1 hypothetical protein [Heyndrickxia sporothermodurans]MBL5785885.1 hypothetical protein [Heyndrickxia sporothermodurans]MBL5789391.1 hypothetical protein [Heyndrickxia sporothermodurans]
MDAVGITSVCSGCGNNFYCTDGDAFCSGECEEREGESRSHELHQRNERVL